jgi:DNA-binding NarL/FixJ family response regulator
VTIEGEGRPGPVGDEPQMLDAALEAALGLVPAPVFIIDEGLRILKANDPAKLLLRERPDQTREALSARISGRAEPQATPLARIEGRAHFLVSLPLEGPALSAMASALRAQHQLTKRQSEVLGLVVQGQSNREIADALGCSLRTVEIHLSAVFRKTGQSSRTKLVMWFYRR